MGLDLKVADDDLRNRCHVNSNEDGDRFVGIKADSEKAMVFFPIGYELPETDCEIRKDIRHLIQVLSEFTTKEDRLLAANEFAASGTVDFPVNAYRVIIEFYFSLGGKYYVETDPVYRISPTGNQHWPRTFKNQTPLVQQTPDGTCSLIYTDIIVRAVTPNDNKLITQINSFCVYEAFQKMGWLYVPYMPHKPGTCPDIKTSIQIVRSRLGSTNDDRKRTLFQGMLDMLEYMDEETSEYTFCFGTHHFDSVWEKLIDRAFGEKNKEQYFPRSRWLLDYGKNKEEYPLMPDSIMIYRGKYYVLDAKCYRYGWTGNPAHLPNAASINKQVTYGEYLEKAFNIDNAALFNAFIMPYNMKKNIFGLTEPVGIIGEAVSDWKINKLNYERIQGIVIDTRYLMYNYTGNFIRGKRALAGCIESVLKRPEVLPGKREGKI